MGRVHEKQLAEDGVPLPIDGSMVYNDFIPIRVIIICNLGEGHVLELGKLEGHHGG